MPKPMRAASPGVLTLVLRIEQRLQHAPDRVARQTDSYYAEQYPAVRRVDDVPQRTTRTGGLTTAAKAAWAARTPTIR